MSNSNEFIWNPFLLRKIRRPISNFEAFIHLIKFGMGTGLLLMPIVFMNTGIVYGIINMLIISVILVHCSCLLVKCAHELYRRHKKVQMTYSEVTYYAFKNGPKLFNKLATVFYYIVFVSLFIGYFGSGCIYIRFLIENITKLFTNYGLNKLECTVFVFLSIIALGFIRDLKSLSKYSCVGNILMISGICCILYYILLNFKTRNDIHFLYNDLSKWYIPATFGLYAITFIGMVMPLENKMKNSKQLIGCFGILNMSMIVLVTICTTFGVISYTMFGNDIVLPITNNLSTNNIFGQIANGLIAASILFSFPLKLFICLEIILEKTPIALKSSKYKVTYKTLVKILLIVNMFLVVVNDQIINTTILIKFTCAFSFSTLTVLMPVLIDIVVFWRPNSWVFYKNLLIIIYESVCMIMGILEII